MLYLQPNKYQIHLLVTMRRYLLLLFLAYFALIMPNAQTIRTISIDYNESDFNITDDRTLAYIGTNQYTTIFKDDVSTPALPYVCLNVLIGPDESFIDFTSDDMEILMRDSITIAPNPPEAFTNENVVPNIPQPLTYVKSVYPDTEIEYTGTHMSNGYKFLTFLVCPFRYEHANKKLYLDKHINLNIRLKSSKSNSQPIDELTKSTQKQGGGKYFFINEEDKEYLYGENIINQPAPKSNIAQDYPYKYLIITSNALKDEFERLAHWKSVKGIKTKVLTVEEIYIQDPDTSRSDQLKIKYAIMDYYELYDRGVKYVLLGGDVDHVPAEMCHIQTTIDSVEEIDLTPADIYYASFTNMEWDNNHNGRSAEMEDSISLSSDIAITRLPASTSLEAHEMINRIIDYEKNTNSNNWDNSMLLCGVETNRSVTVNGRQMSDSELQTNSMFEYYINPNWTGNVFRFYDTFTNYSSNNYGANYDVTEVNLQSELSKGYSFAFVHTHGTPTRWFMETGSCYDANDASALANSHYTILSTAACETNKFDAISNCLGETFMKNGNGRILAYYGSSRNSIGTVYPFSLGVNMNYIGTFYQKMFHQDYNQCLGEAIRDSKKEFISNYINNNNSTRWMFLTLNALGDPEMPVYKSVPSAIPDVTINFNGLDLTFTTGVERPMLCLMSRYDDGNIFYYHNYAHGSPYVYDNTFHAMFGEYSFCLTKKGYLPTLAYIGNTVHLQNETLLGKNNVVSFQTLIGSNVTNQISDGAVTIESGSTVITSHNNVIITGDFEVKPGAEFEIRISNQNQVTL